MDKLKLPDQFLDFHLPLLAKERHLWLCGVLVELEDMGYEHCCVSIREKYDKACREIV